MELRVKPSVEDQGLDVNQHGEEGYSEDFGGGIPIPEEAAQM
jgi:Amt family ammonium transporter